jgi:glycerophosphoryl diester phosphodiesterase
VLLHDATLERTTNGKGALASKTAAEIATLSAVNANFRQPPAPARATWLGEKNPLEDDVGVPTFAAALNACVKLGLWMNVEIKPTPGTEIQTGRIIARQVGDFYALHAARHAPHTCPAPGIVLSSFSAPALQEARRIAPAVPRALLVKRIPADWRTALTACGATALHAAATPANEKNLASICNRAIPVACYTVNDRASADRLFAAGLNAIFTDRLDFWQVEEM